MWDTYRALNPLYTIIQPGRVNDIVNAVLSIYQQLDSLPLWHLMGSETNTMVGYGAVRVIADAYFGNELSHPITYLYAFVDQHWKTA